MKGASLQVRASYLEIYNEDVRDLLSSSPRAALELREDADGGVYAKGLHAFLVQSPADLASVLQVAAPPGLRAYAHSAHAVPACRCWSSRLPRPACLTRLGMRQAAGVHVHLCGNRLETACLFRGLVRSWPVCMMLLR